MLLAAVSYLAILSAPARAAWNPCAPGDPGFLCLALKMVVYRDESGEPVQTREQAQRSLARVNEVWEPCRLGFVLEKFVPVSPSAEDLRFRTGNFSELNAIRETFGEDEALLVAGTGPWDRSGTLGGSRASAWTSMPGSAPFGIVIERPGEANLLAHELGHYLNLRHVNDRESVMNPVIFRSSTALTPEQCETARVAARRHWSRALRSS
jgi:hypothetical protein